MRPQADQEIAAGVTCRRCARRCTDRAELLTWSRRRDGRGESWLCGPCTREAIRGIESGFDDMSDRAG